MPNQFRLVFKGSPFLPQFDHLTLIETIIQDISQTVEPATAIALAITPIMGTHAVLLRLDVETLSTYQVSEPNLQSLTLGFQYPLETIQASAVCKKVDSREERLALYEQLLTVTHNFNVLRVQEQIAVDLNATCNLLKLDSSGALVFQYLKDYPFSRDEFFLTGMEVASRIFFGLALEIVQVTGDDSWLNAPYDPTIT